MRLGVFGGTFDPIHLGHLRAAEEVREALELNRVLLVPAGRPPHRPAPHAPALERLAMVRRAAAGHPGLEVLDLEVRRSGWSYTADTLEAVRVAHPRSRLFLIVGADQVPELPRWHDPDRLARLATLVAMTRPGPAAGHHPPRLRLPSGRSLAVRWLRISALDISATDIRRRLRAGHSVRYLLPDSVRRYLHAHRLYR